MSILTTATRMWLTRSTKPFLFQNEYDNRLPFDDCDKLGLYVHIPSAKRSAVSAHTARPYIPENCATNIWMPF